ncbi:isochorismatase family cysteine hydrolase [Prosthecomicrobium sp. N25]|uniref:isochorismatase family cysteine hydrolase n=1 Tax=Prosthecomicrobium sp. N25 TaxID=3129254 RepID=UPI003078A430
MHKIAIPSFVIDRVMERRGRLHVFDEIDPTRTAMIVVDLQNGFMAPGQPSEIAYAREIVPNVNAIGEALRAAGGTVVYIQNTFTDETQATWCTWFDNFMKDELKARMIAAFTPGSFGHAIYPELTVLPQDWKVQKERFGAFVPGSSDLDAKLKAAGIDTLLIVGTATNVCCESTARDAMMMNYKVIFLSDANACRTDEEHNATLGNMLALFADVRSTAEVVALIEAGAAVGTPIAAE